MNSSGRECPHRGLFLITSGKYNKLSTEWIDVMRYRIIGPEVIHERMDDEVVIIHLETGAYYSLNHSGSDFWEILLAGFSVDEAIDVLLHRYDACSEDLRSAMRNLIERLLEEGLIVADATMQPAAMPLAGITLKEPFLKPVLQRYTDMQALLLQDPIHEVDATGWPAPKNSSGVPGAIE